LGWWVAFGRVAAVAAEEVGEADIVRRSKMK